MTEFLDAMRACDNAYLRRQAQSSDKERPEYHKAHSEYTDRYRDMVQTRVSSLDGLEEKMRRIARNADGLPASNWEPLFSAAEFANLVQDVALLTGKPVFRPL